MLHQHQWDAALAHVQSWTEATINPWRRDEKPDCWTVQEELDNAVAVVTDYIYDQSQ
ncbi:MAG: hypothetical protein Q4A82_02845 [Corynebacterium sp.]|nr:hypothetical protein [Corynebacterium sp.]